MVAMEYCVVVSWWFVICFRHWVMVFVVTRGLGPCCLRFSESQSPELFESIEAAPVLQVRGKMKYVQISPSILLHGVWDATWYGPDNGGLLQFCVFVLARETNTLLDWRAAQGVAVVQRFIHEARPHNV